MGDLQRTSSATDNGTAQRTRAPNFSRPRPQTPQYQQPTNVKPSTTLLSTVRSISAFHEPSAQQQLPSEPRFSIDSARGDVPSTYHTPSASFTSAAPDPNDLRIRAVRKHQFDSQRFTPGPPPKRRPSTGSTTSAQTFDLALHDPAPPSTAAAAADTVPPPPTSSSSSNSKPSIIAKRTSLDQYSERASRNSQQWQEDTASHHTVSSNGSAGGGSLDELGRWTSSENGDVSSLSEAQIKKLQKKGINPALWVEMRQARKGRKWVGPLVGNTFLG